MCINMYKTPKVTKKKSKPICKKIYRMRYINNDSTFCKIKWKSISIQIFLFQINVGCGSKPSEKYPIRLEYSANGGKTWHPLVPNCAEVSSARCFDVDLSPSIYYGGTSAFWRRVIIPLDNVYVCGLVNGTSQPLSSSLFLFCIKHVYDLLCPLIRGLLNLKLLGRLYLY